jgi:hypothetical protein
VTCFPRAARPNRGSRAGESRLAAAESRTPELAAAESRPPAANRG